MSERPEVVSQTGFFGDAPSSLQRALDLTGLLRMALDPTIVPVAMVADLTAPGARVTRGLRWVCNMTQGVTPGAGSSFGLLASADPPGGVIIVDRIYMRSSVLQALNIFLVDNYAEAQTNPARLVDRVTGIIPGVSSHNGAPGGTTLIGVLGLGIEQVVELDLTMVLKPGQGIHFSGGAAGNIGGIAVGRTG